MPKEKEIVIEVMASSLIEDIFEEFFPEIYDEHSRISRGDTHGKERNFIPPIEEIPDPKSILSESEKEWEMGWSEGALLLEEHQFNKFYSYYPASEDLTPFFKVDIFDIQNGKEENKISLPKFVSFAKCKRKRF